MIVGVATLVESTGLLGQGGSALLFTAAIALSAWQGGLWAGLVATAASLAVRSYLHAVPIYMESEATRWKIHLVMTVMVGVLLSVLFEALLRARRRLQGAGRLRLLYEAGRRFSGTLVVDEIYDMLRALIGDSMRYDGMIISSYDPESSVARCVYGWANGKRFDHAALPPIVIDPAGSGMQTEVIRTGESRLYADVRKRVREPGGKYYDIGESGKARDLKEPGAAPPGSRSALMVPIKLEGNVIGIVQIMSDQARAYRRSHLTILETLVAPIAVALQNAELFARAKREIAERTRVEMALMESDERLREADRLKDQFLATLAHELRNPLAPIRLAVDVLRGDEAVVTIGGAGAAPGSAAAIAAESNLEWAREVIDRQVRNMATLLDDLLDVSRISRGALALKKQRVELSEILRNAIESSHPWIVRGGHTLQISTPREPIVLEADVTRMGQVISNLLNNAARYSEDGRKIGLRAEIEGDDAVIYVSDEGIGISSDMLPRIFEPFLQIDRSLERSHGGLGIGLALVKQIIAVHGGTVEARSEGPGKGSEFMVRLPMAPAVAEEATTPAFDAAATACGTNGGASNGGASNGGSPHSGATNGGAHAGRASNGGASNGGAHIARDATRQIRRVLVADDLRDSADALATLLESKGHEVRTAYDGEAAVATARDFHPDVVVLDIGMPMLNGYDAARKIRKECGAGAAPVLLALTGWGHEADRRLTKEAGFDHHLVKPVEPAAITHLVAS